MRDRRYEKGQAIAEMAIGLIAIAAVFLGLIFALAVGQANVENILTARGEADNYSYQGIIGGSGNPIRFWEEGNDGRLYTNDDEAELFTDDNSDFFIGQLRNGSFNLSTDLSYPYVQENFTPDLDSNFIFHLAADLTSYEAIVDPFEYMGIEDLRGAFRMLIYDSDLQVSNEVYMPFIDIPE